MMMEVFISQVVGHVISLVLAVLLIFKQFITCKIHSTSMDSHINFLRQRGLMFSSLLCRRRNWGFNGLEFVPKTTQPVMGQSMYKFRLLGEEMVESQCLLWWSSWWLGGPSSSWASGNPHSIPMVPLVSASPATGHWNAECWFWLIFVASKLFRQRTPKGIWSSFARGENLSSDSWSPEVRDLIMLIMISAFMAPNVISFLIS